MYNFTIPNYLEKNKDFFCIYLKTTVFHSYFLIIYNIRIDIYIIYICIYVISILSKYATDKTKLGEKKI